VTQGAFVLRLGRRRITAVVMVSSQDDVVAVVLPSQMRAQTFRSHALILLILAMLFGLSLSVRAQQVHDALHGKTELTMGTKANVRVQADSDVRPVLQFASYIAALPSVSGRVKPNVLGGPKSTSDSPWYSVVVRHRPPPQSLV
jgi:hypothetical protein